MQNETEQKKGKKSANCSFCRKSYREAGPLVEGPQEVYICGECIALCTAILEFESARRDEDFNHEEFSQWQAWRDQRLEKWEACHSFPVWKEHFCSDGSRAESTPADSSAKGEDRATEAYDTFLCHNSADKVSVTRIANSLAESGIRVWLDEWSLIPGRPWQEELERVIKQAQSAVVLVGSDGQGPWQKREIRGCLTQFVDRQLPVIPVLLPNAKTPQLPLFLAGFTWIDFTNGIDAEGLKKLLWGITGTKQEAS